MARIRSVHPDICTDDVLAGASDGAERLFVRLWTHLDDEGRCVDNPLLLKGALFPLNVTWTPASIDLYVDELVDLGLLFRYEVDRRRYLTVKRSWKTWQKPRHPTPSKLPAPPDQVFTADRRNPPEADGGTSQGEELEVELERRGDGRGEEGESEGEPEQTAPPLRAVDNPSPAAISYAAKALELGRRFAGSPLPQENTA